MTLSSRLALSLLSNSEYGQDLRSLSLCSQCAGHDTILNPRRLQHTPVGPAFRNFSSMRAVSLRMPVMEGRIWYGQEQLGVGKHMEPFLWDPSAQSTMIRCSVAPTKSSHSAAVHGGGVSRYDDSLSLSDSVPARFSLVFPSGFVWRITTWPCAALSFRQQRCFV